MVSERDLYIHNRAVRGCQALGDILEYPLNEDVAEADGFDPVELQEAMALSLGAATPPGDPGTSGDDSTSPGEPGTRQAATRSLAEAGIPATPGSARARKKRGGRR